MKNFCHLCGAAYVTGSEQPWICSGCGNKSYLNSKPTTEIAFFNQAGQVLLARRAIDPNKGKLDLPGGFIDYAETAEHALEREIYEELELNLEDYDKPVYCMTWNANYPFSKEVVSTINLVFTSILRTDDIAAKDDVSEVLFMDIVDLNAADFSYPEYPDIIRKAHGLLFPVL